MRRSKRLYKIRIFIVLMLLEVSLQANYCIQVLTVDPNELHSIIAKASSRNYADFNDVRVESRGRYLVFRIGDYKRYQDARDDIARVRETARNAYIRKCDFIREQAVFIANNRQEAPYYEPSRQKAPHQEALTQYEQPRSRVRKPIVQNIQKKEKQRRGYKQREELISPYRRDNSLWNDCKKCFVPVYGDEEDTDDVQSSDNMQQKPRKIQVKKHKPKQVSKQEPFWAEDVPVAKTPTPKPKRKNRTKNKFHIDEQFLP